jgi:hypothetical protein
MDVAAWKRWWQRTGEDELRAVVMQEWDPIGVSGFPEAADEYDSYLGQIAKRLREGVSDQALGSFLTHITDDEMGLNPRPEANLAAARAMREWYDASTDRSDIANPS